MTRVWILIWVLVPLLAACEPSSPPTVNTPVADDPELTDSQLQTRVQSAIMAASDLPGENFQVQVSSGIVSVTGSLACETCGGYSTPGGPGNVQMSLGAVVRAVPGVQQVRFQLN